jgi:hypothetical protein
MNGIPERDASSKADRALKLHEQGPCAGARFFVQADQKLKTRNIRATAMATQATRRQQPAAERTPS